MPRGMPKKKVLINNLVNLYFFLNDLDNKTFKRYVDFDGEELPDNKENLFNLLIDMLRDILGVKEEQDKCLEKIDMLRNILGVKEEQDKYLEMVNKLNNILEIKEGQNKYLEMINEKLIPNLEFVKYTGEEKRIDEE